MCKFYLEAVLVGSSKKYSVLICLARYFVLEFTGRNAVSKAFDLSRLGQYFIFRYISFQRII